MKNKTPAKVKKAKRKLPAKKQSKSTSNAFPVVAIGASAGGLEAVTELFKHLDANTGMAFIYVQHLSPDHKSLLTALLQKVTSMQVQDVKDKILIAPNNVYVIPPDKEIQVTNGHIKLTPRPESPKINLPIDLLFSSLAATHKQNVIGIILSGSASDGTQGMKSIKHEGGLTFAQDSSAKFASMPKSAIAAGVVDLILPPKEIALELMRISKHPYVKVNRLRNTGEDLIENNDPDLKLIFTALFKHTQVDFGAYKMKTIKRRIMRRMLLYKMKDLKEYAKLLDQKKEELDILYQDLLINVTSFFRDTDTYKYLKSTLLPKLLKEKKSGETLRIWVPACSTGEEAFSIAMMLIEIQDSKFSNIPVQIFASDLSAKAIRKARIGLFTKHELESVSPRRLQRFFSKSHGDYRIDKRVRNMCVFAPHNVLLDPPFSRLDLISCRNLFIYLDTPAQRRVLETFHYAMRENGYLMLGKSETIGSSANLFREVNKKYKVFLRKPYSGRTLPNLAPRSAQTNDLTTEPENIKAVDMDQTKLKQPPVSRNLDSAIDALLVSEFMPPSVVINHQMDIIQFRGATDLFLTHSAGKASFNVLRMVRPEIAFALRNAIKQVIKSKVQVRKSGIEMIIKATIYMISIDVVPLRIKSEEPLLLILFTEQPLVETFLEKKKGKYAPDVKDRRIKQLQQELTAAQADSLSSTQEQDAFIEELQSAHEEVVSSNEELQTVNEELETSKEEMESTNEELITTNEELQTRNDLLIESYDYSTAIISTLHEPMLILDGSMRIKTANESFYKKFDVNREETEGNILYELGNHQWDIPDLRKLLEEIVPKNSYFRDFEVIHTFPKIGEKVLMLNARRIVQKSHGDQLILLSINDITAAVRLQQKEKDEMTRDIQIAKSYNLKLEEAVKQRTGELDQINSSLAEKNAELQKMIQELEAFAYVSSHDLQEPLRKIRTFAGRILEKENPNLSDTGKNYFRLMQNSAERMQALIQDLLAFSRISLADRKFETVEINTLVEEVKEEFRERIEETQAVVEILGSGKLHVIAFQFRQVLQNLISNSLKFAKPGVPPHITITCRTVKSDKVDFVKLMPKKEYNQISVSDNGIGFEAEYTDRIFKVFEKLHSKDEFAGTGIGLAIVKKIVDNHHGFITAKREPAKGTSFDIFIPTT